ncbi:uncharacterized protein LOC128958473 [Oppia nitens]|uniref:uncharacterized protein LOC128958473 n=1 Tax=Oppia nitens TaxID=1686743 RepID=UPI0023DA5449|nr:uncharacterized protein LOC128958473 [Oppia nitens]
MFRFIIISMTFAYCAASAGYGSGGAFGLSGGSLRASLSNGLSSAYGSGLAIASPYAVSSPGPLSAAIQTHRTFEVVPVSLPQEPPVPQIIDVEPSEQPVQVIFRSVSSPVLVQQIHTPGAPGEVQSTQSEDEPHRVLHQVLRPVIQEVREVIQPYRRVTQEVRPVLEEVHTVVAKGEGRLKSAQIASHTPIADPNHLVLDNGYQGLNLNSGLYGSGGSGSFGLTNNYKAKAKKAA